MATALELMGLGIPGAAAGAIGQAANADIVAAGSTAATATRLTSPVTTLTTASAAGVYLPLASGAPIHIIRNNSGANQTIYPNPNSGADTINGTTSVTLTSAKVGLCVPHGNGWLFLLGA